MMKSVGEASSNAPPKEQQPRKLSGTRTVDGAQSGKKGHRALNFAR